MLLLYLLKTVKELYELRLNLYYFKLYRSIENANLEHATIAISAFANYVDLIAQEEGDNVAYVAWKRV
jgi:hypothetical protein